MSDCKDKISPDEGTDGCGNRITSSSGSWFDGSSDVTVIEDLATSTKTPATITVSSITSNSTFATEVRLSLSYPAFVFFLVGLIGFVVLLILFLRRQQSAHCTFTTWLLIHISLVQIFVLVTLPLIFVEEHFYSDHNLISKARHARQFVYYLSFFTSVLFFLFIYVGRFLVINKGVKKKFYKAVFLHILTIALWSISGAACLPILFVEEIEAANILMLSFLAIFFIIGFAISAVFIYLKKVKSFIQQRINENKRHAIETRKDRNFEKSHLLIAFSFYLSWIMFLVVALFSTEGKIILLGVKNNSIWQERAMFLPYGFAALLPYIILISNMEVCCCQKCLESSTPQATRLDVQDNDCSVA